MIMSALPDLTRNSPSETPPSNEIGKHASGTDRAVGFNQHEPCQGLQHVNHGMGNHVRRRGLKFHASSGAISVETMGDVEILLEVVLERKTDEGRPRSREFHACRQAALNERQIAGREVAIEIRHESTQFDACR
ncbi:hypothetical protein ACVWZR_001839 [Bradyrhizobium sp. i1.3.1]